MSTFDDIFYSEKCQKELAQLMIEAFVRRLSRPNPDGEIYRYFIADWLYFERPMMDRIKGRIYSVQFEGPPVQIDGQLFPLGGFVERENEWIRIDPIQAYELRIRLQKAIDEIVDDWLPTPVTFLPATPEKAFVDREYADAQASGIIHAWASENLPKAEGAE